MKKKTLFAATIAGITAYALTKNYQEWKRQELARFESQSQVIPTALGPVEYAMLGEGPAILAIHGSPGGYDHGLGLAHMLDFSGFTCIAPSRPGYLRTPLSSGASPEDQADLYAALLDALHIENAIVLGASGGGPSALQFALRHPERCRGLVMLCAVTQRSVESEAYDHLPPLQRLGKQTLDRLILFDPFAYVLQTLGKLVNPGVSLDLLSWISLASLRKEGYRNDMQQFAAIDSYPVNQINVPTFIAQGTADTDLPFAHSQWLAEHVPNAQLVPIQGAGHLFFVTHREQFLPTLHEFLERF